MSSLLERPWSGLNGNLLLSLRILKTISQVMALRKRAREIKWQDVTSTRRLIRISFKHFSFPFISPISWQQKFLDVVKLISRRRQRFSKIKLISGCLSVVITPSESRHNKSRQLIMESLYYLCSGETVNLGGKSFAHKFRVEWKWIIVMSFWFFLPLRKNH